MLHDAVPWLEKHTPRVPICYRLDGCRAVSTQPPPPTHTAAAHTHKHHTPPPHTHTTNPTDMNTALNEGDLKDAEQLRKVFMESGGGFWVVEDLASGELVGTVGFEKLSDPPGTGELRRMNVSSHARGKGLGGKLVRMVEEYVSASAPPR